MALRLGIGFIALTAFATWLRAGERSYALYDVGNLGCPEYNEARDINDHCVVVGASDNAACTARGFRWFNGTITNLDELYVDNNFLSATGVSETGAILGWGSPIRVFIWADGQGTPMAVAEECEENEAPRGINDSGTLAVGDCDPPADNCIGVLYRIEDVSAITLGTLPQFPDDADYEPHDVNDHGVVVGLISGGVKGGGGRAFIWSDGVMSEVVNTLGGEILHFRGINNSGLVVGGGETANGSGAMSYDMNTGVMTALGPGTAYGVNERGVAVGKDLIDFLAKHAMLYENGEVIDLHQFMPTDWVNSLAWAINNYGWIVGYGEDTDANWHGFVLVPIYDKGDYDGDGDVDLQDSGHFQRCFAAEPYIDGTLHVGCSVFDFDDDVDLDLDDYGAFQSAFTGPTAPDHNPNGPG